MKKNLTEEQLLSINRAFFVIGDSAILKILFELERYGEKNFTDLKELLNINPATLSKKLRLLTEMGIISPDRTHNHLRVYYSISNHSKPIKRILDAIDRLAGDL